MLITSRAYFHLPSASFTQLVPSSLMPVCFRSPPDPFPSFFPRSPRHVLQFVGACGRFSIFFPLSILYPWGTRFFRPLMFSTWLAYLPAFPLHCVTFSPCVFLGTMFSVLISTFTPSRLRLRCFFFSSNFLGILPFGGSAPGNIAGPQPPHPKSPTPA